MLNMEAIEVKRRYLYFGAFIGNYYKYYKFDYMLSMV